MWELQPFVTNCIAVLNEDGSHRLVREVVPVASPRGFIGSSRGLGVFT